MAINFPSLPTEGQVLNVSPGVSYVFKKEPYWTNGAWQPAPMKTALPKNFVINPSMSVSQEMVDAVTAAVATGFFYPADCWNASWGTTGGSANVRRSRASDDGHDYIYLANITALTPTAGEYLQFLQNIEDQRCADFKWGTAEGKQGVFRFKFNTNAVGGGTYSVQIKGGPTIHTWLAPFTAAANTWQVFEFAVPPPPTASGVWGTLQLSLGFGSGTTYGGGVAGWQAGNKVQMAGNTNGFAANTYYLLTDVGFYLDPYKTGVAPPFEEPIYADELRRAMRYWYRGYNFNGPVVTAAISRGGNRHPVPMRTTPSYAIVGTPKIYDLVVTPTITSVGSGSNAQSTDLQITTAGGLTAGRPGVNYFQTVDHYLAVSARL